ncbi:MAG: hypothetical protein KKH94_11985 [Candidatus Omnitrophica bacterium]|nr:hypothetical protein [Candidatus Omnitrophota bacterium]
MVFEFAIEPELVATWGDFNNYRFFVDKFGIGQSRIMAEYPKLKNWRRKVLVAAPKDGMELERVTALIQILSENMIARNTVNYDGNIEWLENTEKEDSNLPFQAILALSNPRNYPNVLNAKILGVSNNSKWHIKEQLPDVPRKASDIAEAIRPLLQNCHTAIFIDPYFMAKDDWWKWQRPFIKFMQALPIERYGPSQLRVEFHSSANFGYAPSSQLFKQRCTERLTGCIPEGLSVCFKRWKEKPGGKQLHDRYLITDIGGVDLSTGLDEGSEGKTQKISLLKLNTYETTWKDYVSEPAFNLAEGEFTILGCKIL